MFVLLKSLVLATSLLLLVSAAKPHRSAAPVERPLAVGSSFVWDAAENRGAVRLRSGNLHISITPHRKDDVVTPTFTISKPGSRPIILSGDQTETSGPYERGEISVGRWDRAGHLFAMLADYSKGAHCCLRLRFVIPAGAGLKLVDFDERDARVNVQLPRDLDGDGRPDLVLVDDSFLYAFADYADSIAPRVIYDIVNGELGDISDRPSFVSLYRRDMVADREPCVNSEPDRLRNGACAAYVADAARAGQFEQAWKVMLRVYDRKSDWSYPTGCRKYAADGLCPDAETIHYADFPEALRAFLKDGGYIK